MPQTDSAKYVALFAVAKRRANFASPFRQALGLLIGSSLIFTKTLVLALAISISSSISAGFTTVPVTDKSYIKKVFALVQQNITKKSEESNCAPQFKVHESIKGYFALFTDLDIARVTKSIYGPNESELQILLSKNSKRGKGKVEIVVSVELDEGECKYFNIGRVFD